MGGRGLRRSPLRATRLRPGRAGQDACCTTTPALWDAARHTPAYAPPAHTLTAYPLPHALLPHALLPHAPLGPRPEHAPRMENGTDGLPHAAPGPRPSGAPSALTASPCGGRPFTVKPSRMSGADRPAPSWAGLRGPPRRSGTPSLRGAKNPGAKKGPRLDVPATICAPRRERPMHATQMLPIAPRRPFAAERPQCRIENHARDMRFSSYVDAGTGYRFAFTSFRNVNHFPLRWETFRTRGKDREGHCGFKAGTISVGLGGRGAHGSLNEHAFLHPGAHRARTRPISCPPERPLLRRKGKRAQPVRWRSRSA